MVDYYTGLDAGAYAVNDCSLDVFRALARIDEFGRRSALSYGSVVFVAHSLGGIVVRDMLVKRPNAFQRSSIGLYLVASPSLGSDYANALSPVSLLFRNKIGAQLKRGSAFLESLDDSFMAFLDERKGSTFFGKEAIENHPPILAKFLPSFKPIVSKFSAARYFADRIQVPGTNHSTIAKPDGLSSRTHEYLVDFLRRHFVTARLDSPVPQRAEESGATDVLFNAYEERFERYYHARRLDSEIEAALQVRSVWLHGGPGVGKTCAVRRAALRSNRRCIDISLGQCASAFTCEAVLGEIAATLRQLVVSESPAKDALSDVVRLIQDAAGSDRSITLFVDEVPIGSEEEGNPLYEVIASLLIELRQRSISVSIIVCSLMPPRSALPNRAKFAEHMAVLPADQWSDIEITSLIGRIVAALPELDSVSRPREQLVLSARGSPRFIKTYFNTAWWRRGDSPSQRELIVSTTEQLATA